jgi:NADPH-dependent curcumin reductase CurA
VTSSCTSWAGGSTRSSGPRASGASIRSSRRRRRFSACSACGTHRYVGLLDVGELADGDIVFVSGAAGAVGSLAGQIAKLRGHVVIGSAGSEEKASYLRDELHFDAAFTTGTARSPPCCAPPSPDGIDVYFDNVGGDHSKRRSGR